MFSRFRPSSRPLVRATHAVPATPTWSVNHLLSSYPKPSIDDATLVHLHKLSALQHPPLGSPQFTALKHDMEQLIRLVEAVKLVDTTGVKIDDGLVTEFAADKVALSADSEPTGRALMGHAKQTKDGFYIVESDRQR